MRDKLFPVGATFPVVRYSVFFFSMVVAILVMLLLSLPVFGVPGHGRAAGILELVTYYVDPLVVHLCGIACVSFLIWCGVWDVKARWFHKLGFSLFVPSVTLVLVYFIEEHILKPSFAYPRPPGCLVSPWLTGLLKIDEPTVADSCPSGFVVRQMFLLMTGLVFYRSFDVKNDRNGQTATWIERTALTILAVSVVFVAFSRIYRGFHTIYDIGVSVSVSCYLFWFFYYLISVVLGTTTSDMGSGIAAATCILVPVFLYYSQEAHWWVVIGIVLFWAIGLAQILQRGEADRAKT